MVCHQFAWMPLAFEENRKRLSQRALIHAVKRLQSFRRACNVQRKLPFCTLGEFTFLPRSYRTPQLK